MTLALIGPGMGIQRGLGLRPDAALVLPLGLSACAGAYLACLLGPGGWAFALLLLGLNLLNLRGLVGRDGRRALPVLAQSAVVPPVAAPATKATSTGTWASDLKGAVPPLLVGLALLAPTQFPWNREVADGSFVLDPIAPYDDAVFHVGLARELTLGLPPQVPGLAGVPLGYHLGQGLVRAAALRFASVSPLDQVSRFDPVLLVLGLILALRGLAARIGLPPLAVTLAGFSPFLTDFSFLFAAEPSAFYWTDLLKGNLLLSLAYVNPVVPGLVIALGVLVALARHESGEGRHWLTAATLLAAALPHFKVFLGAHLLLGLGAAAVFADGPRRLALAVVGAPCAAMTAALALGRGGASIGVTLAPFDLARITRQSLDLPAVASVAFAAWCALWVFASLGLRWLGLWPALVAFRRGPRAGAVAAAIGLSAWPLGVAFRIAVQDALPDQKVVNDAAYILEQGAPLLWLFAAAGLGALAARWGPSITVALTLLLALPSTVQFAVKKSLAAPDRLPAAMVRATVALARVARPGDVVLQRPGARYPPAPVLLANLRVPYERYTPFRTQFATKAALERRHQLVFDFFRTENVDEARAIASGLGARWLVLHGTDRVRFPAEGFLELVYEEDSAHVYRLTKNGATDSR